MCAYIRHVQIYMRMTDYAITAWDGIDPGQTQHAFNVYIYIIKRRR